jgi:Ca2+/Na+ antiporter
VKIEIPKIYQFLVVIAGILFVKPFKVATIPFLRDAGFYLLALGWLAFILLYDKTLFIWQPIVFIVLYIVYVGFVLLTRIYYNRVKRNDEQKRKITRASSKISGIDLNDNFG